MHQAPITPSIRPHGPCLYEVQLQRQQQAQQQFEQLHQQQTNPALHPYTGTAWEQVGAGIWRPDETIPYSFNHGEGANPFANAFAGRNVFRS